MNAIPLDAFDIVSASVLVLLSAALSLALQLGLQRQLLIATARMIVQLTLVGLVLKTLFALVSPWWTGLTALLMVLFAGQEITARQERRLKGPWSYGLGTACMLLAASLVTVFALTAQVRPDPWYDPRYTLPLLGMILGNTMTGISLGLQTLTNGLVRDRAAVEAQLMLGETRWQALRPAVRSALRSALMPIINSMAATGLVALPGMMTGQILAGAEPMAAVKYQMLIMFLIAGGTTLGAISAVLGGVWRLTDARHRLRLDRLR
ncbi:MAG: iron export ABC transporter permease subunit FetB [Gammaproteobacteria bacterium]|nr:iron export ABC transporter permease subunit FetB [Gammaproteobacteria bacterium]MCP5458837.1 iron export ABC transporter permease subunit FetB [Gammaproteobacteria bacterium]